MFKIRKFFKTEGSVDVINTKVMVLHSSAFALYLLSVVIFYSFNSLHYIYPGNQSITQMFNVATVCYLYVNFIS